MPWPLEAVLVEVEAEQVDAVVFGGDFICGPYPQRTLDLVQSIDGGHLVRGNCEREAELPWLRELPLTVSLDGVLYCHSTPADDLPIISAATPMDEVDPLFEGVEESMVVIGHTHHQFDRAGRVRVVNAGSVGMPYEGEVAAFWALVEDGEPRFRKTAFDVERAIAELETSDWPPAAEFVTENLRASPDRDEAIAWFESQRA